MKKVLLAVLATASIAALYGEDTGGYNMHGASDNDTIIRLTPKRAYLTPKRRVELQHKQRASVKHKEHKHNAYYKEHDKKRNVSHASRATEERRAKEQLDRVEKRMMYTNMTSEKKARLRAKKRKAEKRVQEYKARPKQDIPKRKMPKKWKRAKRLNYDRTLTGQRSRRIDWKRPILHKQKDFESKALFSSKGKVFEDEIRKERRARLTNDKSVEIVSHSERHNEGVIATDITGQGDMDRGPSRYDHRAD